MTFDCIKIKITIDSYTKYAQSTLIINPIDLRIDNNV